MEILLVFECEEKAIPGTNSVIPNGTDLVSQLRIEIQKRLMTRTNDLKLLLELNDLSRQAGTDFRVYLFDYTNDLGKYCLWMTPSQEPSWLKLFQDKFGDKFEMKAKYQFVDASMTPLTLVSYSYSTGESRFVLNEDGSFAANLSVKECTPYPELKDKSDFGRPILSLILSFQTGASKRKLTDQCAAMNQKMLKEELATDVVIVSESGKEFKCHKSFLFAHSPVLQAMFLSDMEESRTGRIEVPDLSEKVVEAFLQYLYTRDTSKVAGNCELCFGLLYAGHKYQVKCLEGHAIELLRNLKDEDYPLDITLKLFLFLGNAIPESEDLKKRAAAIMKKNYHALATLPEYVDLFKKTPEAMELTKYFANA